MLLCTYTELSVETCSETEPVGIPEIDTLALELPAGNPLILEETDTSEFPVFQFEDEEEEEEDEEEEEELSEMLAEPVGPPNPDISTDAPLGPAVAEPPNPPKPEDAVAEFPNPPADALPPKDEDEESPNEELFWFQS